jgi:23S rRNA (uridine2552-2'-O)-methyltransferase
MGGNQAKRKHDHYTQKAKSEGYPARSVYKLKEIQQKLHLIKPGNRVLDVGAAPGSWTLYASELVKEKGFVLALDLQDIDPVVKKKIKNGKCIQTDMLSEEAGRKIADAGPFDIILSDAAPATTGNRTVDTGKSFALVSRVITLAEEHLVKGGSLVVKIFQGGDEQTVLERMRSLFGKVKPYKPKASRKPSFETYLIGTGKR